MSKTTTDDLAYLIADRIMGETPNGELLFGGFCKENDRDPGTLVVYANGEDGSVGVFHITISKEEEIRG